MRQPGWEGGLGENAAAAAKWLQSCPTLYSPIDGSAAVSSVHGILQARTLEWVSIAFSMGRRMGENGYMYMNGWIPLLSTCNHHNICCCYSVAKLLFSCYPHDCSTPSSPILHCLLEFAQIHIHWVVVIPSNRLILCCPLLSCPQSLPASGSFPMSWLFASGGQSIGTSALASVLPMNIQGGFSLELTGLISRTLKSLLQHHNSKASILQCSAFFMVQLSHPYMTTGKTIALTRQTFVGKVMSLLFNMLSRFVIAFLPRNKHLLISWLQSPSAVILEPRKIKSVTASTFPQCC